MDQTVVSATTGRELGSRPSRRLRAEGKLPAVIYGLGKDPVNIAVDYAELRDALKGPAGMNTVLRVDLGGTREPAIIRDVQRDPIKRRVTHVDFLRVDLDQKIKVHVPIHLIGEAEAVLSEGGVVEQSLFEVEVECAPDDIPDEVVVDQTDLTLDSTIFVSDLDLPEGVELLTPGEQAVVSPVLTRAAFEDEEEDGEAEEAVDGEAEASDDDDADGADEEEE